MCSIEMMSVPVRLREYIFSFLVLHWFLVQAIKQPEAVAEQQSSEIAKFGYFEPVPFGLISTFFLLVVCLDERYRIKRGPDS